MKIIRLFCIIILFFLSGCPRPSVTELYNNTGKTVSLITLERTVEWNANTVLKISDEKDALHGDEFAWVTTASGSRYMLLKLEIDGIKKDILLKYPHFPDGYIDSSSGGDKIKMQLEKDVMFYLIPFKEAFPVKNRSQLIKIWE